MKLEHADKAYWWEGTSIKSGTVIEVDKDNFRYWVVEDNTGNRVEMDDSSAYPTWKEAEKACNDFWFILDHTEKDSE